MAFKLRLRGGTLELAPTYSQGFAEPPEFDDDDDDMPAGNDDTTMVEERAHMGARDDFEDLMDTLEKETPTSAAPRPGYRTYTFPELEHLVGKSMSSVMRSGAAATKEADEFLAKRKELAREPPADDVGQPAPLGRNRIKEWFQRGKRALGLGKKAREMKVYGDINPSAGSFAAGLLALLDEQTEHETLQTAMGGEFSKHFSQGRFRTEEQRCSLYVQDKQVRQLLDNSRISANFYVPLEGDTSTLPGGFNYTIMEYDLRSKRGKDSSAAKFYGLFKSSLLHKPDLKKNEDPTLVKSVPIVINFGRHLGDISLLPQIAGSLTSPSVQAKMEKRLWYSTGVMDRGEPMVIFRFSAADTPVQQTLDFVYIVVPQKDARAGLADPSLEFNHVDGRPGLAGLLQAINTNEGTRMAATTALANIAQRAKDEIVVEKDRYLRMLKAGGVLADLFVDHLKDAAQTRSHELRHIPVTSPGADPELVGVFTDEFENLFGYLATLEDTEAKLSSTAAFSDDDRAYVAEFQRANAERLAVSFSEMIFAARCNVYATDAVQRIGVLWLEGKNALQHFSAPSTRC